MSRPIVPLPGFSPSITRAHLRPARTAWPAFVRLDALRTDQLSLSDARTAAYGSDWDRLVRVRRFR
jgi:hypothetical protein